MVTLPGAIDAQAPQPEHSDPRATRARPGEAKASGDDGIGPMTLRTARTSYAPFGIMATRQTLVAETFRPP